MNMTLSARHAPLLTMLPSLRRLFFPRVYAELGWLVQIPQLTSVQPGPSLFQNSLHVKPPEALATLQRCANLKGAAPHSFPRARLRTER